jgi:hypothetical protein
MNWLVAAEDAETMNMLGDISEPSGNMSVQVPMLSHQLFCSIFI